MIDIDNEPIQINFRIFKEYRYLFENTVHNNKSFFDSILEKHECFIDKIDKNIYNSNNNRYKKSQVVKKNNFNSPYQKKKERTKIGDRDISKESILIKDFKSILNKVTENNIEKLITQTNNIIDIKHINIILELINQYLISQSNFQHLYILLLNGIYYNYSILQLKIKQFWADKFNNYLVNEEWTIDEKILGTDDYDDFCNSTKIKKEKIALIKSWARLKNNDLLDNEPKELFNLILSKCFRLDMDNIVHRNIIDNYIEQLKEYYSIISEEHKIVIIDMYNIPLNELINYNLPKISYFKLLDFLETISLKNENI